MSAQPALAPTPFGKRKLILMFAPLAILASAAVVANLGGVSKPAKAAAINVTATVNPASWSDANGCSNSIAMTIDDGTPTDVEYGTCTVTFGVTNATSDLFIGGDTNFWTQGGNFYTNYTSPACNGTLAVREIGFKVNTGGTASVVGSGCVAEAPGTNGGTSEWRPIPRNTSTQVCQSTTIGTKTCPIEFGARGPASGDITAASYAGVFTPTAA